VIGTTYVIDSSSPIPPLALDTPGGLVDGVDLTFSNDLSRAIHPGELRVLRASPECDHSRGRRGCSQDAAHTRAANGRIDKDLARYGHRFSLGTERCQIQPLREKRASPGKQNVVRRGEDGSAVGIEEILRLLRVERADVDSLSGDCAAEEKKVISVRQKVGISLGCLLGCELRAGLHFRYRRGNRYLRFQPAVLQDRQ